MLWTDKNPEQDLVAFTVDNGAALDTQLLPYDVAGTRAHVAALQKAGILTEEEADGITVALNEIMDLWAQGKFAVATEQEDSHTAIEQYVTRKLGVAGEKMHAGRSRNDQALTALRLYVRDQLEKTLYLSRSLQAALIQKAVANDFPMPGYTHMQKAMPYNTALWLEAFAHSLADDEECIKAAHRLNDQSPLGSGAGYGSGLPIDRRLEAGMLGFSRVQENTLYCQNSRGKTELFTLAALQQVALTLNKLATDILLYSTTEYGFLEKPARLCTGSSMMPHKQNPDAMELVRARTVKLSAAVALAASVHQNLPSGYHRDFQETKQTLLEAFAGVQSALLMTQKWVTVMAFKPERLAAAMTDDLNATQRALDAAKTGTPFRQAYKKAKAAPKSGI